jgi:hypothetical protein
MTTSKSKTVSVSEDHQQSQLIQQLQEQNANLQQQVVYLRGVIEESKFVLNAMKQNPNATYTQAQHIIMQRRSEQDKAVRQDQLYQFEQNQALIQQEKFEELKKRTIEKYPHIEKKFQADKKNLEKVFEDTSKSIKQFFDMDEEKFREYQSFENDVNESPIQYAIDYEPGAALQAFRCIIDGTPFFTLNQTSSHFWKNRDMHEERCINELRSLVDKEISNARANMNKEIEEYSKVLVTEDQKNAHQAQKSKQAEQRRRKKELPFI